MPNAQTENNRLNDLFIYEIKDGSLYIYSSPINGIVSLSKQHDNKLFETISFYLDDLIEKLKKMESIYLANSIFSIKIISPYFGNAFVQNCLEEKGFILSKLLEKNIEEKDKTYEAVIEFKDFLENYLSIKLYNFRSPCKDEEDAKRLISKLNYQYKEQDGWKIGTPSINKDATGQLHVFANIYQTIKKIDVDEPGIKR